MANKFPYVASAGPIVKAVNQLRKSFPKEVTAETLRKLGIAPNNESYVINVLRHLKVIDEQGRKVDANAKAFVQHEDAAFAAEFAKIVEPAYEELFELHKDASWTLDRGALTQFFRSSDHSSEVVGLRQATTFEALAGLAGYSQPKTKNSTPRNTTGEPRRRATKPKAQPAAADPPPPPPAPARNANGNVGLTVRIEVNLPANGDQETYDRIFQSIRTNLINGA